jgi:hypothetical protein
MSVAIAVAGILDELQAALTLKHCGRDTPAFQGDTERESFGIPSKCIPQGLDLGWTGDTKPRFQAKNEG